MENNYQVSIIVPIYNVEDYLENCVYSLVNQTYENIEILLIDDGSTDRSGKLADELAKSDSRIKVFHKKNGGLSDTRNYGFERANADWIVCCDPDDWYDLNAIELLVKAQLFSKADMIITPLKTEYTISSSEINTNKKLIGDNFDREEAMISIYYSGTSQCGKLLKKEYLLKHPNPVGMTYEDVAIIHLLIGECNRIFISKIPLYHYYKRPGSIVNSKFTDKKMDFFKVMNNHKIYIRDKYNNNRQMSKAWAVRYVFDGNPIASSMYLANETGKLKDYRKEIYHSFNSIIFNKKVNIKGKVKYLLMLISPGLYVKLEQKHQLKKR